MSAPADAIHYPRRPRVRRPSLPPSPRVDRHRRGRRRVLLRQPAAARDRLDGLDLRAPRQRTQRARPMLSAGPRTQAVPPRSALPARGNCRSPTSLHASRRWTPTHSPSTSSATASGRRLATTPQCGRGGSVLRRAAPLSDRVPAGRAGSTGPIGGRARRAPDPKSVVGCNESPAARAPGCWTSLLGKLGHRRLWIERSPIPTHRSDAQSLRILSASASIASWDVGSNGSATAVVE